MVGFGNSNENRQTECLEVPELKIFLNPHCKNKILYFDYSSWFRSNPNFEIPDLSFEHFLSTVLMKWILMKCDVQNVSKKYFTVHIFFVYKSSKVADSLSV